MKSIKRAKIKQQSKVAFDNFIIKKQKIEREGSGSCRVTQKMLDTTILRFIVEDIQSLSIIDNPAFINLIRIGIFSFVWKICRKTLKQKPIDFDMKSALEKKFNEIKIVSTTADLWRKMKRLLIQSFVDLFIMAYLAF